MRTDARPTSWWLRPMVCTGVGMAGNVLLTVTKIVVGLAARSSALVADGFHSLADVASDVGIVLALKASNRPPDDNHPYGHQGFETLGAIGVALLMLLTGFLIGKDAVERIWTGRFLHPELPALVMGAVSVALKEGMARYTIHAGRAYNSPALLTNGAMHRSDAISSLAATGGVLGAILGVPALDSVAALVIGVFILRMGWQLGTTHVMALMDTMPEPELVEGIRATASAAGGAEELRDVRVRQRGSNYLVDIRLAVEPDLSVGRAHDIAHDVEERVMAAYPDVTRVFVHVEPAQRGEKDTGRSD